MILCYAHLCSNVVTPSWELEMGNAGLLMKLEALLEKYFTSTIWLITSCDDLS